MVPSKENLQINDLIFKELIKRGYSLEGNTRVWNIADSKLWYLTPQQARAYLNLDDDPTYQKDTGHYQGEKLVDSFLKEVVEELGNEPFNIVDLGCGNGKKAAHIIKEIKKLKPNAEIRYCPIDISSYMVESAINEFKEMDVELVEFQYNISDFDNLANVMPLLKKGKFKRNLVLMLGNTVGNFEIHELLYDVRISMDRGDLFIIDLIADDKMQERRSGSYGKNAKFNDWLIHVPLQLGLKEDEVEIGGRWRSPRIEVYYTVKVEKEIKFQNKSIKFNQGDQIIVVVGYKYDLNRFKSFLNIHFDEVSAKISDDLSKIVAVCRR